MTSPPGGSPRFCFELSGSFWVPPPQLPFWPKLSGTGLRPIPGRASPSRDSPRSLPIGEPDRSPPGAARQLPAPARAREPQSSRPSASCRDSISRKPEALSEDSFILQGDAPCAAFLERAASLQEGRRLSSLSRPLRAQDLEIAAKSSFQIHIGPHPDDPSSIGSCRSQSMCHGDAVLHHPVLKNADHPDIISVVSIKLVAPTMITITTLDTALQACHRGGDS